MLKHKRAAIASIALALLLVGAATALAPRIAQDRLNPVLPEPAEPVSERALALHQSLLVADLHADTLA